jgi:hypothetical protein
MVRGWRWRVAALGLLLVAGACSDDGGGGDAATESTIPTPTIEGDGTAFCDAMLAVGRVQGANGSSPQEVLASTEELLGHLDQAQANTPSDAPPDFDSLLDDYRLAAEAISDARGDVTKAFAALEASHADVVARLRSSSSHAEAFAFLLERCGDDALPGEG